MAQQKGDDHVEEADAHLILGMIMSGPAAPILKSFVGIGSTTAYAADGDRMAILREKTETEASTGNSRQLE